MTDRLHHLASGTADVVALPHRVELRSEAAELLEPWRGPAHCARADRATLSQSYCAARVRIENEPAQDVA